ncbi:hypothetical protein AB0Q95_05900 [Streptomyces sp. NPDC059900]|uniref:hypothetical protein n=1 Tax=Streptomyces sp. NPDC059900 TaxID=3155816 RepID=UPI0034282965
MDNTTAQTPEPAPRRRPGLWMVLCLVLASVVLGLGGFLAGRAGATDADTRAAEDCSELRELARKMQAEAQARDTVAEEQQDWLLSVRSHAYLIKQNPECFTAESRAKAQATLDRYEDV